MTDTTNWIEEIGKPAFESIAEMVAALECDYDRLEALREERQSFIDDWKETAIEGSEENGRAEWETANPDEAEELAELEKAASGVDVNYPCESQDDARQKIEEDALSVEVRSGWESVGETLTPSEFNILLTTGGPAVRIRGELDNNEPHRAWLEVQDWGKPWSQYFGADQDTLLTYARVFYFGE